MATFQTAVLLLAALCSVGSQRVLDVVLISPTTCPELTTTAQAAVSNVSSSQFTLNLVAREAQCSHRAGQSVLYSQLTGSTLAAIGAGCSEATTGAAELAALYNLPLVSYSSTSLELDEFPTLFRTVPSDASLAAGIAGFIAAHLEWGRLAVITQDNQQFKLETRQLIEELRESNVSLSTAVLLPPDLRESVTLFPPDHRVFVLNMEASQARFILCEALSLGLGMYQYVWILGDYPGQWWLEEDTDCNGTSLGEFLSSQRAIAISYHPQDLSQTCTEDLNCSSAAGYVSDSVLSLALALNQTLTNNGSVLNISALRLAIVESLDNLQPFSGVSGYVVFRNRTRFVESLVVRQYRGNGTCLLPVAVGTVSTGAPELNLTTREGLWPGGVPSDGAPVTVESFPLLWITITSYLLAAMVIVGAVLSMIFTCVFRKRKLVRLTSPNLNMLIAIGVITFNSAVFLFTYPTASHGVLQIFCVLRAWLVAIGVSLCFGTVNAKMFRIHYIFYNPNPAKMKRPLLDWHLLLLVLVFVAVDLVILIPASVLESARLSPVREADVEHPPAPNAEGITVNYEVTLCESQFRLYWLCALFGYKAIIQIIGLFLALRTRNVKIKVLNDSKEIAATIYLSSAILAVIVVVSVALSNRLNVYIACYCYGIPLSTSVVLIVVFFSKMVRLYKDPLGENIFTQAPGSGTYTNPATIDLRDDKSALESKVRKLTLEVARLKEGTLNVSGEMSPQDRTAVTILSNSSLEEDIGNSYTLDTFESKEDIQQPVVDS